MTMRQKPPDMAVMDLRLLTTGSRNPLQPVHRALLRERLCSYLDFAVLCGQRLLLVHGACKTGVDAEVDAWGEEMKAEGQPVELERHPAEDHGPWPQCGPKRNEYMALQGAYYCVAMPDRCDKARCINQSPHDSHGTASCMKWAKTYNIPMEVHRLWVP